MGLSLGMGQARHTFLVTETSDSELNAAVNAHGSLLFKRFLKDYYFKRLAVAEVRSYSRTPSNIRYDNLQASFADQYMRLFNTESAYQHVFTILRDQMQIQQTTLAGRNAFLIGTLAPTCNVKQIKGCSWTLAEYSTASLAYDNPGFIWWRTFEITLNPEVTLQ